MDAIMEVNTELTETVSNCAGNNRHPNLCRGGGLPVSTDTVGEVCVAEMHMVQGQAVKSEKFGTVAQLYIVL
jgi:hypothetical protein